MEKIQKLESALDRAATHRHSYEENGKRCRAAMEEVRAGLAVGIRARPPAEGALAQRCP